MASALAGAFFCFYNLVDVSSLPNDQSAKIGCRISKST